jgi:hypothetical protein
MLRIKLHGSYRSKQGNVTFRYAVTGTPAELAAYKAAQGDFYREDPVVGPLWFTTRFAGPDGKLIITQNNKVVADMSAFDAANSLATQYGGNFGQEIAKGMVASLLGNSTAPTASSAPSVDAEVNAEEGLDQH